jgi:serine/threonine protein kinase
VPRPELVADRTSQDRFLHEARKAVLPAHPNVVPISEVGAVGAVCYIASVYCSGERLADWLKRQKEPPPPRRAATLMAAVADGVQHAHDHGIFHGRLEPSTILLVRPGDAPGTTGDPEFVPRVTDLGLANLPGAEAAGASVGAAGDVAALGAILYELLTGRTPGSPTKGQQGNPTPPRRLRPELPGDLETVCLKCLRPNPADRYCNAAALAEDLRRFLNQQAVRAVRPTLWDRLRNWRGGRS